MKKKVGPRRKVVPGSSVTPGTGTTSPPGRVERLRTSGGKRRGAGRARTKPPARRVPWRRVRELARVGVSEADILAALELPAALARDPDVADKLRQVVATEHARFRAELQRDILRRGKRTNRGSGSVNALALQARAHLGWDRQVPESIDEPDIETARDRLRKTLEKLAANRSEMEGRTVTWLELLLEQAGLRVVPGDGPGEAGEGGAGS